MGDPFEKLRDLDLSRDEVDRIGEALKKEEFRKMLADYVEEIQDPENVKLYEKEIIELEKERGIDAQFIKPNPGYVIKTSVEGNQKCFINICVNEIVPKPTNSPACQEGSKGLNWALPHTLIPPRDDLDNKKIRCKVFDVVFHPDTLHLARKNKEFYRMVNNTALDAIEKSFNVKLDKKNLRFPKLNYKGLPHSAILRKPSNQQPVEREGFEKEIFDKLYANVNADSSVTRNNNNKKSNRKLISEDPKSRYTTPKYNIKHRSHVEVEEFIEHKHAKINAAIPKELIIEINLPLLKSSGDITLDVTEKTLQLISEKPAKYKVNITLPYRVNQDQGNAKFDKDLKKLIVTLPVKRNLNFIECNRDDSGVESDQGSPLLTPEFPNNTVMMMMNENSDNNNKNNSNKSSEVKHETIERTNSTTSDYEDIDYMLPEFSCHLFETTLAFTLNVKNVDGDTIKQKIDSNSILVRFTSIGASFYPVNYSFYIKLPSQHIIEDQVLVEAWDNNVILQLPLEICDKTLDHYMYGIDEYNIKKKFIEEPIILSNILQNTIIEEEPEDDQDIDESSSITPTIISKSITEEPEQNNNIDNNTINKKKTQAISIFGTSYESSGDELSCSSYSPSKSKGILKRFTTNRYFVGRSISESSLDDFVCSSVEMDSAIPENGEMSTSLKKTVRFNDTIMRQLYRSNSSILGQKQKNQRKARNKKRALERRHSESEASEIDDKINENGAEDHNKNDQRSDSEKEDINSPTENNASDIFQMDIGF